MTEQDDNVGPRLKYIKEVLTLYEVVSPVGRAIIKAVSGEGHLDTLEGKTICQVWNREYRGDELFPLIAEELRRRYPKTKVIPYTDFPLDDVPKWQAVKKDATGKTYSDLLKEKGCDAVMSGNGG